MSYGRIPDLHGREDGRGGGIRTPDNLLPKQVRYQAALHPDLAAPAKPQPNLRIGRRGVKISGLRHLKLAVAPAPVPKQTHCRAQRAGHGP